MQSLTVDASAVSVATTVNAAPVDASADVIVDVAVDAALVIEVTKASEVSRHAQSFQLIFNMHCDIFYLFPSLCFGHLDQATNHPELGTTTCCLGPANAIHLPLQPTNERPHDDGNKQNLVCRQCTSLSILRLRHRMQQCEKVRRWHQLSSDDFNFIVP